MAFKKATDIIVLCELLLLSGLAVSGALDGIWADIAYIAAFVLPTVLGLYLGKRLGLKRGKVAISRRGMSFLLPIIFPAVLFIIGISVLTSFVLSKTGAENSVTLYPTFAENLIRHAIIPAVLEEALFRYLAISLMAEENRRGCILISSVTFALIHCNLFQIPYAAFAGIIFVTLDIILDSPIPSIILHMVNNTASVISLYYQKEGAVIITVSALALISLAFVIPKRREYISEIKRVFENESKYKLSSSLILIVLPTLIVSILNIIG